MNPADKAPLTGSAAASELGGIPELTLSQRVARLEYQCHELNHVLGEVLATCLINLESGALKCTGPAFRQYLESRSAFRVQLMDSCAAMSSGLST